jgi:hypothetical protein
MPYDITIKDNIRIYTVTTPNWFCEWIFGEGTNVKRQCYLKNSTLNIFDTTDALIIHEILPEIINEINTAIDEWTKKGDPNALELLTSKNIPAYLTYAKSF